MLRQVAMYIWQWYQL